MPCRRDGLANLSFGYVLYHTAMLECMSVGKLDAFTFVVFETTMPFSLVSGFRV